MTPISSLPPLPSEQPVRFYKFVALSFLLITLILLGTIVFMSSRHATITITTKSEPLEVTDTIIIDSSKTDSIIHGFVTSTIITLEKTFSPSGSEKEDAEATGEVTFYNESTTPQALIATTRLLSEGNVLFRLKNPVTVPAEGSIAAVVYADEKGAAGNIGPSKFTIPGLREDKQKVIYAKSEAAMDGGVRTIGVVSQADITKAEQSMLEEFKKQGGETLSLLAGEEKTGLFDIAQSVFDEVEEMGKQVNLFTLSGKATVVGIFYDTKKANDFAIDLLKKQVVDNNEVLYSMETNPSISLDGYDLVEESAKLHVSHRGLVNIDENSKDLQKTVFFGKSEDEVKRYVMSLNHVGGVEMSFRPMWSRTVPRVAGSVDIVIREVK